MRKEKFRCNYCGGTVSVYHDVSIEMKQILYKDSLGRNTVCNKHEYDNYKAICDDCGKHINKSESQELLRLGIYIENE